MLLMSDSWKYDVFVLLIGAVATLFYLFLKRKYSYWNRNGFKTAPNLNYLYGHLGQTILLKKCIGECLDELYKSTTEPFIGIYSLLSPILLLRDPELIQSFLVKDFSHFTDRGVHCNEDADPISANLISYPGEKWKRIRTQITPAFSSKNLKLMFTTLINCGSNLQNHLENLADKNDLLDVREISAAYTTDVIASVAFGIDTDSINNPKNEFRICGQNIFQPIMSKIRLVMWFYAPKLMNMLRIRLVNSKVANFLKSIVMENLEYREKNNVIRRDIFQLLIQLRNTGSIQLDDQCEMAVKSDENVKTMSFDEILGNSFVFFAAGFETSSTTLTFLMYELAKNHDIQEKLYNEIHDAIKRYGDDITYECIGEMKYLDNCIDETLRKYSNVPILIRSCVKEYRIPGTHLVIEKGVNVIAPIFSLHRDEQFYETPLEFMPDRFSERNSVGRNTVNRPFMPFGIGQRNCIGLRLGKMQIKVALVIMLRKFKFDLEDKLKNRELLFDPWSALILAPKGDIKLNVYKR